MHCGSEAHAPQKSSNWNWTHQKKIEMVDAEYSDASDTSIDSTDCIGIWSTAFDISKLPQAISLDLIKRAPFLLGTDHAHYSAAFFRQTGGLCNNSYRFKQLMNDNLFPLENLVGTYPLCKKGNRHPLKLIRDKEMPCICINGYTAECNLTMGSLAPPSSGVLLSFIRETRMSIGQTKLLLLQKLALRIQARTRRS